MQVDCRQRLQLEAYLHGRVMQTHSHRRQAILPDALVVAALQFPGEDGLLHALAVGHPGQALPMFLRVIPNPRDRGLADECFAEIGAMLGGAMDSAAVRGGYPQLVVASRGALDHLTNLADDLRFWSARPATEAAANRLSYFTRRAEEPGQQAVVMLTAELSHHWVTPLLPAAEHHLGMFVAALTTPPGADLFARAAAASQVPMGPRTDPVFDRRHLEPALRRYADAARGGASPAERGMQAAEVHRVLAPVLLRIWRAIQVALRLLEGAAHPLLPVVADLQLQEGQAFGRFQALRAAGGRLPRHDRARGATLALTARDEATATLREAIACHDRFGRAMALGASHHLEATVVAVRLAQVPGRQRRATVIDCATPQRAARLRVDDELITPDGQTVAGYVQVAVADGGGARFTLVLTQGVRDPSRYMPGRLLRFTRRRPDPHRVSRAVRAVAAKLALPHWTRADAPLPVARRRGSGEPARRFLEVLP